MFAHGETVTRLRAMLVLDDYSGEESVPDWEAPYALDIAGCGFNPGSSTEPAQDARNSVVTQPEVFAPPAADILESDRLVVRGVTYAVDGNPADWRSPFTGWRPGLVVKLKAVEG